MTADTGIDLVLASTSRYRRELLSRLRVPFRCIAPEVDETRAARETPSAMAMRLAEAKARAVAAQCAGAVVIGSDQVAELDGRALGKPGSAAATIAQLRDSSGRTLSFHTAVCVIDGRRAVAETAHALDTTHVVFRVLAGDEIARYVDAEQPYDCAGGFKAEALGITLFERIDSRDPTALIGLPLIALARLLRTAGIALP